MKKSKKIISALLATALSVSAFSMSAFAKISNDDSDTGSTDVTMSAKTIPQPTYTVEIPSSIGFSTLTQTVESNIESTSCTITASGVSNLYANKKMLVVKVASENNFNLKKDNTASVPYSYYLDDNDTALDTTNKVVLTLSGTAENDKDLTKTANNHVSLNTKDITIAGDFSDHLTFTVELKSTVVL